MTSLRLIRRSADPALVDLLVTRPCETLAALMTAQLPSSPELAGGLAKLDEARQLFRLAAAAQICPPTPDLYKSLGGLRERKAP